MPLAAQELSCNVIVNGERVQTQERQVFDKLQQAISDFINNTKWTKDKFREEEKIKCNMLVTLKKDTDVAAGVFAADVQIQYSRPVFGTDYESPILNYLDAKWAFKYNASDPLIFQENTFTSELTSLLAYYAYIIIGLDYDTFAQNGGSPYYERALNILQNTAQQSGGSGWGAFSDTRDRYWLIENLISPQFTPFREALYDYHRLGMDNFGNAQEPSRQAILEALKKIETVVAVKPMSVTVNTFFNAKSGELAEVFSRGDMGVRLNAVELLSKIDPTNASKYKKVLK